MKTTRLTIFRTFITVVLLLTSSALWAVDTQSWSVGAGGYHNCALNDDGVTCWGENYDGYHGPTATIPALSHPVAISAGLYYTCALDDTGVVCWDWDSSQINVPPLTNPVAVSAGYEHTCALDANGVQCWGANYNGQITVPALSHPVAVSAGSSHTCALDDDGVKCWGANYNGQITVPALSHPVAVSAGNSHTCVLDDSGVKCWGDNGDGQTNVPVLSHPTAVSAGGYHTCALDDTGVVCWGANYNGQITVPALSHPVAVSAGQYHTCAIVDSGVVCWGDNNCGQTDVPAALRPNNCPHASNPNQLDADGDGLGDECDPLEDDGTNLNFINGDTKAKKLGSVVAYVGDFNKDGFGDYAIGSPNANKGAGSVEIISGNNGDTLFSMTGTDKKGALGFAIAGNADINGDGIPDVVVSAPLASGGDGEKSVGRVYVIYGAVNINNANTPDDTLYGTEPKAMFGAALALGNFDNNEDHNADVVIGEPKATNDQGEKPLKQAGKVTVLSGLSLNTTLLTVYGQTAGALAGTAVAAGDVNGQAGAEVIVGAPNDDDTDNKITDAGSVKIYRFTDQENPRVFYGEHAKDYFGKALSANADVNKDGVNDVLVGVPGLDHPSDKKLKDVGGLMVVYGSNSSAYSRSANVIGTEAKSGLGSSVALGDVNKDGYADLIVGAPKGDNPTTLPKITKGTGSVTVYSGNDFAQVGSTLYGEKKRDAFGTSLSAGDINADGKADIVIGIPGFDIPANGAVKAIKDAGSASLINATVF